MTTARRATLSALLVAGAAASATAGDRGHPPSPAAPRALHLPPVEHLTLSNGLAVSLVGTHELPTVEVLLLVRTGALTDPAGRPGTASMTASMLDEGAGGKDTLTLADAVDFLGAELSAGASWESTTVALHVPVARLAQALPLMADVALRPDFPPKELERLRKEALTALLQARDEPRQIATLALNRAVFGETSRYGKPLAGDSSSIGALTVADLKAFHSRHFQPGNAALILVGDITPSVEGLLESTFGAPWRRGGATPAPPPPSPQLAGRTVWLVDKPGAPQSVIRMGRVAPPRLTPDYHALEVMNTLLGGSFTSRLNDNLREQHGYAYGAGSRFVLRRATGLFQASTDVQTPSTLDALRECLKELGRIRTPATPQEVERARNYLALSYAQEFETSGQIAMKLAEQVVYGLPENSVASFVPTVLSVGVDEVRKSAVAHVDPDRMAIVVVGDRKAIEAPLRSLGGAFRLLTVDAILGPRPSVD